VTPTLADVFARARSEGRAALIGYLPAGFPSPAESVALITEMVAGGVEIVEVGLPYSDPLMDGPDIQAAVDLALREGTTTDVVLRTVAEVAESGAAPVVMSYWNPIERYGVDRFARGLAAGGGRGVITPDLTPEEAGPWIAATDAEGLDRIFLVAPSSVDERIRTVATVTSGFLYAASTMGVTGARTQVSSAAPELVRRCRTLTDLPIAVGLGVSTGEQAREVAAYAEGVIVGSAFVRRILRAPDAAAARRAVRELAEELAAGVRGAGNADSL
jgi:tryptophan synthase alpha chain